MRGWMTELSTPSTAQDWDDIRVLLQEYATQLDVDLCFQDFAKELAGLPGAYQAPQGALLVAHVNGALAGCGAFRPLATTDHANACEMKRLYVRPLYRGQGLGRTLAEGILKLARQAGYTCMVLDSLSSMQAARAMYRNLGFTEIAPYYHNPIPGAQYLKATL